MSTETITIDTHTEEVTVETETFRHVHFDGRTVELGAHAANPTWVHLRAEDDSSAEYFGSLDISLPANVAIAVGQAMIDQAKGQLAAAAALALQS